MSAESKDVPAQPLVIVRRRRNSDEGHHGGAWKIAYADFMTAMMAFFLVMWLVNAADKKTIIQVAAYFNPIKLTDKTEVKAGLEDQSDDHKAAKDNKKPEAKGSKGEAGTAKDEHSDSKEAQAGGGSSAAAQEQELFEDPEKTLDSIAAKHAPSSATVKSKVRRTDLRDPFERTANHKADKAAVKHTAGGKEAKAATSKPAIEEFNDDKLAGISEEKSVAAAKPDAGAMSEQLLSAVRDVSAKLPELEMRPTPEGLLLVLSDTVENGMFEVGSAKPTPDTVVVLEKIGALLKAREGRIVVRGHTDGRGYRSKHYDNWRLSAARAQMAYHMLVRGGIDETRFMGVEGRADREPRDPADKDAPKNRRIEILIKEARP